MIELARSILIIIAFVTAATNAHADFAAGVAAFQNGDYEAAYREWRPLAEQGDTAAQHNLGTLYNNGLGLDVDMAKAANWYRRAAQGGNANAQTKMGIFLARGWGLAQDYDLAAGWFREAAEQHHAQAQYNLGILYAMGAGVDQDRVQALMWLNLAHQAGVKQAARPREVLIGQMPPEEVEEAALLAEIMAPPMSPDREETAPVPPKEQVATVKASDDPAIAVQLAAYESEQEAVDGWRQLRQVHGDLLGRLNYGIAVINIGQQGVYYRLFTGPFETASVAKSLCAELKARNIYCAVSF